MDTEKMSYTGENYKQTISHQQRKINCAVSTYIAEEKNYLLAYAPVRMQDDKRRNYGQWLRNWVKIFKPPALKSGNMSFMFSGTSSVSRFSFNNFLYSCNTKNNSNIENLNKP